MFGSGTTHHGLLDGKYETRWPSLRSGTANEGCREHVEAFGRIGPGPTGWVEGFGSHDVTDRSTLPRKSRRGGGQRRSVWEWGEESGH